jgi:hypothetical protein
MHKKINKLNLQLQKEGENAASTAQHLEDALRYLALFLADNARHDEAKTVGIVLNNFRAKSEWEQGNWWVACKKRISVLLHGEFFRPGRVGLWAIATWIFFAFLFKGISLIAPEPAILLNQHHQPEVMIKSITDRKYSHSEPSLYHYFYFSGATLTNLSYGDIMPNTKYGWGVFPSIFAVLEAFLGYIFLGMFVAVLAKRTHTYARLPKWLNDFETEVLSIDYYRFNPTFYTWHWKRYSGLK